jgi:hypothetical protein
MSEESKKHELRGWEECSLFNSAHAYHDNFNRAICACGWKSTPAYKHEAIEEFKFHVQRVATGI